MQTLYDEHKIDKEKGKRQKKDILTILKFIFDFLFYLYT